MKVLCERNLKIYFANGVNVFLSLLGALIVLGLYVLFLRKNMLAQLTEFTNGALIADFWLLGGMLVTTSLTTSLAVLGQLVKDRTENKLFDLVITDRKLTEILLGYFLSGFIISFLMQLAVLGFCLVYFQMENQINFNWKILGQIIGLISLSSLNATTFNLLICMLIKTESTLRTFSSILGAVSGFICTAYLPIGSFSTTTALFIKMLPISYAASSLRTVLVEPYLDTLSVAQLTYLKEYLGLRYMWGDQFISLTTDIFILFLTAILGLGGFLFSQKFIKFKLL